MDLALEERKVICQHFPVEFFSNELLPFVLVILSLSIVVNITVKQHKFVPLFDILRQVIDILLTHIVKVVPAWEVVHHYCPSSFVEQLLLKILAFIHQFLKGLSLFWKHKHLCLIVVVPYFVNFLDDCWILNLPSFIILLFK